MEVPVLDGETRCGTLSTQQRGLYTHFHAVLQTDKLCRLYARFEGGETALGIPVPENDQMGLSMSVPTRCLPPGRLCCGCIRGDRQDWTPVSGVRLGNLRLPPGCRNGDVWRFPWQAGDPIPCEELMCFFRYVHEAGKQWLEISLDENGVPKE